MMSNKYGSLQLSQAEKLNTDPWGRVVVSEREVCQRLYIDPKLDISGISLDNAEVYNSAINKLYLNWEPLQSLEEIVQDPATWHQQNQKLWLMPQQYQNLDIAQWVLDQCRDQHELQRAGKELLMFADLDQLGLLKYLKYLVDTMRANKIVWGVGRGSSVASFVLYLIGVHKVHSLHHDLDIAEFLR
jgi:DNA polymerase III alpha subunit